jgi:hypothetical protein
MRFKYPFKISSPVAYVLSQKCDKIEATVEAIFAHKTRVKIDLRCASILSYFATKIETTRKAILVCLSHAKKGFMSENIFSAKGDEK